MLARGTVMEYTRIDGYVRGGAAVIARAHKVPVDGEQLLGGRGDRVGWRYRGGRRGRGGGYRHRTNGCVD